MDFIIFFYELKSIPQLFICVVIKRTGKSLKYFSHIFIPEKSHFLQLIARFHSVKYIENLLLLLLL